MVRKSALSDGVCIQGVKVADGVPNEKPIACAYIPGSFNRNMFLFFLCPLWHGEIARKHSLLSRIDLVDNVLRRVRVPRIARVLDHGRQHFLLDQGVLLDRVDVQAAADVPCDVAMEGPRARVVGVVLQDDVCRVRGSAALDQLRVAALRVLLVRDDSVPFPETLGEHVEIVAVEMHGVGG